MLSRARHRWPASRQAAFWAAALVLALSPGAPLAQRGQPQPVLAGLWDVSTLLTVERRVAGSGEVLPPPQSRQYRLCIGPERARAPMLPSRLPPGTELMFGSDAYEGGFVEPRGAAIGPRRQVDFAYRRLSATAFEGSHDVASPARVARLQYFAQYLRADCGDLKPTAVAETGEP